MSGSIFIAVRGNDRSGMQAGVLRAVAASPASDLAERVPTEREGGSRCDAGPEAPSPSTRREVANAVPRL